MRLEIVSIGDELLKGQVLNTNALFLAAHLQQKGYAISRQTTLSDESDQLRKGLVEALDRTDLVITTGGLGPTLDDRTRDIAADIFGFEFAMDEQLQREIQARFPHRDVAAKDQARIPKGAKVLVNKVGTAPGLFFQEKGKALLLLPGVPKEMEPMFLQEALPLIEKIWPLSKQYRTLQLFFCHVYESLLDSTLRGLSMQFPHVEVGIYPNYGFLSVVLQSADTSQLFRFEKALRARYDTYIYEAGHGKIEEALKNWFVHNKKTVAFAESCTGGNMASHVTSVPGASEYFLGSFVVYADSLKEHILGVSKNTLKSKGAVSQEVVREMLEGLFQKSSADFGIAVCGVAGPDGGNDQVPVGTICAAIGEKSKPYDVGTFHAFGNRHTIIASATNHLLCALWRKAAKGVPAFPFFSE